ncbi:MAG TPA: LCP family protein [Ktedonobacteraceae bacterium]
MRICSYCGAEIPDGARFCGLCGRVPSDAPSTMRYPSPSNPAPQSDASSNPPFGRTTRRPYQYPPVTPASPSQPGGINNNTEVEYQYPPVSPTAQPRSAYQSQPNWSGNEAANAFPQQGNANPASWQQGQGSSYPAQQPNAPSYPAQPPLYISPANGSQQRNAFRRPRRRRGCMIGCLSVLVLLIVLGTFTIVTAQKVLAFGSAISTQSPLSTQTGFMNTSDRINILMMGYGGTGHAGAFLTDSLVIMSIIPSTHHTTLISVPRDLWVQYPPNSGNYTKINAIYTMASNGNANPVAGGDAIAQKVSLVTGLNISYWMTINFTGFKRFIDAIGGIDVNVPDTFNACYPKNDDASVDASWIKIQFNKGLQHMNGATAIEYARAREPVEVCGMGTSINQAELTDFGRSRRQQLIMQAALSKLKQWQTWPSLYGALDALKGTLYSNLSLADLASFALKMDLNGAHRLGLTNNNVLVDSSANGQYILAPRNNDWQGIVTYVKQGLYN